MSIRYTDASVGGMLAERRAAKEQANALRRQVRELEETIVDLMVELKRINTE